MCINPILWSLCSQIVPLLFVTLLPNQGDGMLKDATGHEDQSSCQDCPDSSTGEGAAADAYESAAARDPLKISHINKMLLYSLTYTVYAWNCIM